MILLTIVSVLTLLYAFGLILVRHRHNKMIHQIEHRIHVNGIRGKSSVTRLIAASLREGKVRTLAKTTGTAARVITGHRAETAVIRHEAAVGEQRRVMLDYFGKSPKAYQAIVFECMAINPLYQKYLEDKVMQSTVGVITNIREDHMDLLGTTLPEIARSLSATIPYNGHLVTAETNQEVLTIFEAECRKRHTRLHAVGSMVVGNKHMARFKHFEYKSNVAIAIKVAQIIGIDRTTAIKGMLKASADPGAFKLKQVTRKKTVVHWANLFAINDRESFVLTVNALSNRVGATTKKAIILNNRKDRPERVAQFVNICVKELDVDYIFTFGDYEYRVQQELKKYPDTTIKIVRLGNTSQHKNSSGSTLLNTMVTTFEGHETILFGAVNIHTPQAHSFLSTIEGKKHRVS
ncbi:poly-gamma-glutamate synthase PgsB [bacterium]|nr:MAG: poly-gamma-glutamate synthase PgsB [bacterium]